MPVEVAVPVQVGVAEGPTAVKVALGVTVAVFVRVAVGVRVGVGVFVDLPLRGVLVAVGEGPKVTVAVGGGGLSTAFNAAAATTMPLPQVEVVQLLPGGKDRAVLWRI